MALSRDDPKLVALLELLSTAMWYDREVEVVMKPCGISLQQYNVLRILEDQDPNPLSLKAIQARLLNQTANATRLVNKLETKELLSVGHSKYNKKTFQIKLTTKGKELLDLIQQPLLAFDNKALRRVSLQQAEVFIGVCRDIRRY